MNTRLRFIVFFSLVSKTDAGYGYGYGFLRCQFQSEDGHDTLYTAKIYINKHIVGSYNSTEEKYTGYTEKAKEITDGLNKNQHFLEQERKNLQKCKDAAPMLFNAFHTAVQKPQVRVFSTNTPHVIVCSAYSFYPKDITLTWLRNGEEVMSDVVSTEEMSNGNWLYQKHSYLEYTPTPADIIHCMVEHQSLPTPELHKWARTDNLSESRRNKIFAGTAGLLLGLAFAVIGIIYYKKRTRDCVLEPNY